MYRFILNEIEIEDHPAGWDNLEANIVFDKELNTLSIQYTTNLTFYGQGYSILTTVFNTDGYCTNIPIKVYKNNFLIIDALIFLSDCRFNPSKKTISTQIVDKSYYSYINNNKKIKANFGSGQSKNSTATNQINIDKPTLKTTSFTFYDSTLPGFIGKSFNFYDLKESFEFLIQFMSDGKILFESSWYDNLADNEKIGLFSGNQLRAGAGSGDKPAISFYDLYTDIKKLFNLCIIPQNNNDGTFTIRIEHISYLSNLNNGVAELSDVNEYEISIDTSQLPAKVVLGSDKADDEGGVYGKQAILQFLGTQKEEYHIQGECNIDSELDLTINNLNLDHNNIYKIVINNDDSFDTDVFIFNYDSSVNLPVYSDPFSEGIDYIVNRLFFNDYVANRYNLQGAIAYFVADYDGRFNSHSTNFQAQTITIPGAVETTASWLPLPYNNETFDASSAYNTSTYRYSAPSSGLYLFDASISINWENTGINSFYWGNWGAGQNWIQIDFRIVQYDNTVSSIKNKYNYHANYPEIRQTASNYDPAASEFDKDRFFIRGNWVKNISGLFNLTTADIVQVELYFTFRCGAKINSFPQTFNCTYTFDGGGIYEISDVDEYKISLVDLNHPLDDSQIQSILSNPFQPLHLVNQFTNFDKYTFANNIKIDITKNLAQFQLRADRGIQI